jgi:glycerol-3-phosphate cytidylyltransferase-like family protein
VDTRSKILTLAAALELRPPPAIATGYFDVLRAEDARELRQIRDRTGAQTLLVVVLPLANELVSQRARAELVAALRVVDYVVTADYGDLDRLTESLKPSHVVRLEAEHARRDALWARQLMEHVHRRQTS